MTHFFQLKNGNDSMCTNPIKTHNGNAQKVTKHSNVPQMGANCFNKIREMNTNPIEKLLARNAITIIESKHNPYFKTVRCSNDVLITDK